MRVYVIRHGESESNRRGIWTGQSDVHLTEKGREDAARVGRMIEKIKFDKIYTSDLVRACETAEEAIPGCEYECTPLLREVNVGDITAKPLACVDDEMRKIFAKEGYTCVGGESREAFVGRIGEFISKLEGESAESVAVFAHAGVLRAFLDQIVGVVIPRKNLLCANLAMGIFEYSNGVWKMCGWINPLSSDVDVF